MPEPQNRYTMVKVRFDCTGYEGGQPGHWQTAIMERDIRFNGQGAIDVAIYLETIIVELIEQAQSGGPPP